ncbi:MAG: hypothetical protein CM15mP38_2920 [Synechococcus sp.]|nr:MAG: hypothetical protein CM15mP38_2920 [Synechococcus sp.]
MTRVDEVTLIREYLKSARRVHAGLLRNAQNVRVSMQSPTFTPTQQRQLGNSLKSRTYGCGGIHTYQTGGVAGAAGAVDISSSANLFKNLWSGIKRLDRDDVGQQKLSSSHSEIFKMVERRYTRYVEQQTQVLLTLENSASRSASNLIYTPGRELLQLSSNHRLGIIAITNCLEPGKPMTAAPTKSLNLAIESIGSAEVAILSIASTER